jgi:hypothetical protein
MTNDDIACLRLLADWHDRQAHYLLLTVPTGQHDQGRFHSMAAARLSRLADEVDSDRPRLSISFIARARNEMDAGAFGKQSAAHPYPVLGRLPRA